MNLAFEENIYDILKLIFIFFNIAIVVLTIITKEKNIKF